MERILRRPTSIGMNSRIESIDRNLSHISCRRADCGVCRGFLAIARDQFVDAAGHFSRALEVDSRNIAAANNRATCWLYANQLATAVSSLEDVIWDDPLYALQECVVFNLCSLYDLQSGNSIPKKMALLELINAYAHEGFDRSVLKLPQSTPQ